MWVPTVSDEVEMLAVPPLKVALPKLTLPSRKSTVPPGVPDAGLEAVTVAVKVVDWPNTVGFVELTTVVELAPLLTVWVMAADALALKLVSPPYETLIV